MLVSDLPEAQNQAVALGALPGFGKSALSLPQTLDRLRAALRRREPGWRMTDDRPPLTGPSPSVIFHSDLPRFPADVQDHGEAHPKASGTGRAGVVPPRIRPYN